jgi:hypothetical protein
MSWLTAPPSDHWLNTYDVFPKNCGELAVTEIQEPWIEVIVAGVVTTPLRSSAASRMAAW